MNFKTAQGQSERISSRDAVPHALFNEIVANDATGLLAPILAALDRDLQPSGMIEEGFIESMAVNSWRQFLARGAFALMQGKSKLGELGGDTPYRSLIDKAQTIENLSRLERFAVRGYNRAFKSFKEYRMERRRGGG